MTNKAATAAVSQGRAQEPDGANTAPRHDNIEQAIAAASGIRMANVQGTVHSSTRAVPVQFSVPADLTYEEALAAMRGFVDFCQTVIDQQRPASKLALVHGPLPRA